MWSFEFACVVLESLCLMGGLTNPRSLMIGILVKIVVNANDDDETCLNQAFYGNLPSIHFLSLLIRTITLFYHFRHVIPEFLFVFRNM